MGESPVSVDAATKELCNHWGIATLCAGPSTAAALPKPIREHFTSHSSVVSIWLMDSTRRCLHLLDKRAESQTISLASLIAERLNTPTWRRLRGNASTTFAQVLLLDATPSRLDAAEKAAAALKDIEPMLPRPVTQPAEVVVVSAKQRDRELLLMWALGIDSVGEGEALAVVLYGRGRLAGSTLVGKAITHPALVAQLALVGESCECETDRAWLAERTIPFYWDEEDNRIAKGYLGFNPGNRQVQDDVQRVIARGQRLDSADRPDTIERIVSSYMESHVDGYQPRRLEIPPGNSSRASVTSTVIQGDGWEFEEPVTPGGKQTSAVEPVANEAQSSADTSVLIYRPKVPGQIVQHTERFSASTATPAILSIVALAALAISFAIWKQSACA